MKLKPCPFCKGETAEMEEEEHRLITDKFEVYYLYYAFCHRCLSRGPQSLDREIALKLWNRDKKKGKKK
jgi:hypothetical protein